MRPGRRCRRVGRVRRRWPGEGAGARRPMARPPGSRLRRCPAARRMGGCRQRAPPGELERGMRRVSVSFLPPYLPVEKHGTR
ncbi:MAG: hypothetical protein FJZ96_15925, partial [Chloroflexi bacterium]|nr:hypothetical protein [Chloroflexota bacterium]